VGFFILTKQVIVKNKKTTKKTIKDNKNE